MKLTHSPRRVRSLLLARIDSDSDHEKLEAALRIGLPRSAKSAPERRDPPPETGGTVGSLPRRPHGPSRPDLRAEVAPTLELLLGYVGSHAPVRRAEFGRRWALRAGSAIGCGRRAPAPLRYL